MKRLRAIIKTIIFFSILILLLLFFNIILKAKWIDTTFPTTTAIDGFYDEPNDSIDILFLGSSHMMSGISPVQIWKDTGMTGYTCGSTKLSIPSTYLYLQEAVKAQHPSVVVMDVSRIFKSYKNEYYEEDTRRSLDYIPFSQNKLKVAETLIEGDARQSLLSYAFPLIRYHSRWSDLREEDFTYPFADKHMALKGQSMSFTVSRFVLPDNFMDEVGDDEGYAIDAASIEYFEKMVKICRDNGIAFILIKTPCYSWNKTKNEIATDLAASYEIPYIDYCTPEMQREIDFVSTEDFQDEGDHLNSFGAIKISKHLGNYIWENYKPVRSTTEDTINEWERDAAYYDILLEDAQLDQCDNLIDYLGMLKNKNYIAAVAVHFDAAYCITPEVIAAMRELGLAANLEGKYKAGYAAVIEGGKNVCEGIALEEEVALSYSDESGELSIDIVSSGAEVGNFSSIVINGKEYSKDQTGLNFAVYDKRIGEVISEKRFNTHSRQYSYGTELQNEPILRNFIDLLSNKNYVAFIETKGILTDKDYLALSQWVNCNSTYTMEKRDDCCTAIICEAGSIINFKQGREVLLFYHDQTSEISVLMHGIRGEANGEAEFASIKLRGVGKSKNETGINVVVCDKRTGQIVCRKTF